MYQRTRFACGFSLLELVMSLAIIAIAAAIAAPRYASAMARYRADMAARRVAADLAMAQQHARTCSTARTAVFSLANNTYTLVGVPSFKDPAQNYRVNLRNEPYTAIISSLDLGGDNAVVFNGYGIPDGDGKVVIATGGIQRTVLINAGAGGISIE